MTAMVMRASPEQRTRIKGDEGLRTVAYKDTVGKWTIGYGHAETNARPVRGLRIVYQKDEAGRELRDPISKKLIPVMDENGRPVLEFYTGRVCEGVQITTVEAERVFDEDMDETERGISACVTQDLSQNQFDALTDFVHQYGLHNLSTSTLLLKINFNPNSPAVLDQFMRWTMAGGEHKEYVWRRSARRCILYNGTPCPQGLYSKNGFPFVVDPATDHIDYSVTPTIQKLIDIGKKKAEPYKFDPSAPIPQAKPEPTVTIITDKPSEAPPALEPIWVKPEEPGAEKPAPAPTGDSAKPPLDLDKPIPAGSSTVESPGPPAGKEGGVVATRPPMIPPTSFPPVVAPKPPSKFSVPITDAPYRIDPNLGLKPMEDTQRWQASLAQNGGMVMMRLARYGSFGSLPATVATFVEKDPIFSGFFLASVGLVVLWVSGHVRKCYGDWQRHHAEKVASQAMV
jgi:GH24 family phage-related lysozyme (muramidase)